MRLRLRSTKGTCDVCAEGDVHLPYEEENAWICDGCWRAEERAIRAGCDAWTDAMKRLDYPDLSVERLTRMIIAAYHQSRWENDHIDGYHSHSEPETTNNG